MMCLTPEECRLVVECVAGITLLQAALLGAFLAYVIWSSTHHG